MNDILQKYVQFPSCQSLVGKTSPVGTDQSKKHTSPGSVELTSPKRIMEYLNTVSMGRTIFYAANTISTNEDAKILSSGAPEGALIIAETQSAGKGRLERRWESLPGGIFMSLVLKPQIDPAKIPNLAILAGYCIAKTLKQDYDLLTQVKWPNDVLANGRKVAGILCEMKSLVSDVPYVIVGIGINANIKLASMPKDVQPKAASLCEELGQIIVRERLIANILNTFEPMYFQFLRNGLGSSLPQINQMLAYKGQHIVMENAANGPQQLEGGILQGLDKDGRLILRTPEGSQKSFWSGDVSLRQSTHTKH